MRKALVITAIAAAVLGVWTYTSLIDSHSDLNAEAFSAVTVFPAGRALPAIDFIDYNGGVSGPEIFRGKWSLLFMGFTNCGHLCPMTLAQLRMAVDAADTPVNVVFFSVDPGRDTPAVIRDYVQGFDKSFVGMTASVEDIEKLAKALGAPYFVDTSPDNYVVDHASTVFLVSPEAELRGTISQPFDLARMTIELDQLPLAKGG